MLKVEYIKATLQKALKSLVKSFESTDLISYNNVLKEIAAFLFLTLDKLYSTQRKGL